MKNESGTLRGHLHQWLMRQVPATAVRRVGPVVGAIGSDLGGARKENQDRAVVVRGRDVEGQTYTLIAVADGVGGLGAGSDCASLAISASVDKIQALADYTTPGKQWVLDAIHAANQAVVSKHSGAGGSTLVLLLASEGGNAFWASIGDSRLYILTGDSKLTQLSVDDTIAGQLGRPGGVGVDDTKLLQFIGMQGSLEFEVSEVSETLATTALLTTDGVHFLGNHADLLGMVIRSAPDAGATSKRLLDIARWVGGTDNATIAIVPLDFSIHESMPSDQCVEIWDAFGELRVAIVRNRPFSSLTTRETQVDPASRTTANSRSDADDESPPSIAAAETVAIATSSKTPGKKPAKKRKRKAKPAIGVAAPQVQLEFSGKKP
jgi:PPM family protein phosphatase